MKVRFNPLLSQARHPCKHSSPLIAVCQKRIKSMLVGTAIIPTQSLVTVSACESLYAIVKSHCHKFCLTKYHPNEKNYEKVI